MKYTYLFIFGSLFITQTVLAQRERFNKQIHSKHSKSTVLGNGAGGPNSSGGAGDFRPVEDPKIGYISAFNDAVKNRKWSEATNLQSVLKDKFNFLVYFERTLSPKEQEQVKILQAEYVEYFRAEKFDAAKEVYAKAWNQFAVRLIEPIKEVAVVDTKLTEKQWAYINEAQLRYNKNYLGKNFVVAKEIYNEIFKEFGVALTTPKVSKGEILTLQAAQPETVKIETLTATSTNTGIRAEAVQLETVTATLKTEEATTKAIRYNATDTNVGLVEAVKIDASKIEAVQLNEVRTREIATEGPK